MFERYAEEARRTIFSARYEAAQLGSSEIVPEHILLGLLKDDSITSDPMMIGVSIRDVRDQVLAYLPQRDRQSARSAIPLSRQSRELLERAEEEARTLLQSHLNNHHILLALVRFEESFAAQVLRRRGLSTDSVRRQLELRREKDTKATVPRAVHSPPANLSPAERKLCDVENRVLELFRLDDYEGALKLVDDAITDPALERNQAIRMLTPLASNIARIMRNLELVKHYCELRLGCDPENAMGLFTLADCLLVEGETKEAMEIANKAHKLSVAEGSVEGRSVAELIEHRFPHIKSQA